MSLGGVVITILLLVGLVLLATSVKIVRPHQYGVVQRRGRRIATREPGLHLMLPFVDTMQIVDKKGKGAGNPPTEPPPHQEAP